MKCLYNKCKKEFEPLRPWQKFCSINCRNAYHREKDKFCPICKAKIN